ncbi:MAG: TIGR04563 family protein [Myxococcaceae bacterium]
MSGTDNRKQSLYFPEDMLGEIQHEAGRQDRSISWIVQQAWKVARADIRKIPSVNDVMPPAPPAPPPGGQPPKP